MTPKVIVDDDEDSLSYETRTGTFKAAGLQVRKSGMRGDLCYENLDRVRKLGEGRSSKVFLMRHKVSGKLYACKYLNASADADARQMAINELNIVHQHSRCADHLVHLVDAFYTGEQLCLALEYADGGSMRELIARAAVPLLPLGCIAQQILHGLAYLHRELHQVCVERNQETKRRDPTHPPRLVAHDEGTLHQVHRDLKPENILTTRGGLVKLADFGISKQLENTASFATTQVGTREYMAPERVMGLRYGFAADVWAVGIITLEALTAEHPYRGQKTFIALSTAMKDGPAPGPPEGTPPDVRDFIGRCLTKQAGGGKPCSRPTVRVLLASSRWMKQVARGHPQSTVMQYLKSLCEPRSTSPTVPHSNRDSNAKANASPLSLHSVSNRSANDKQNCGRRRALRLRALRFLAHCYGNGVAS